MRHVRIRRELDTAIGQVHKLGWYVALPQPGDAFFAKNLLEGAERSFVDGSIDVAHAQGVRERVNLELQADLDNIEGSYDEAVAI